MLIVLGVLIGLLIGAVTCARFLKQEMAANVGPRLRRIEMQLDALRAELNLATETRLAALRKRIEREHSDD